MADDLASILAQYYADQPRSLPELADKYGYDRSALSQLLRGSSPPTPGFPKARLNALLPESPAWLSSLQHVYHNALTNPDLQPAWLAASFIGGGGPKMAPETIVSAATKYGDHVFTAPIHGTDDLIAARAHLGDTALDDLFRRGLIEPGFMTSAGRFVGRDEALSIARQQQPGYESAASERRGTPGLHSDDLDVLNSDKP